MKEHPNVLINTESNGYKRLRWTMVEQNKWMTGISRTNFICVIITALEDGKYELKYIDAELKDYSKQEKYIVRQAYDLSIDSKRMLALRVMEYYGHYEWIATVANKEKLIYELVNATSFNVDLLENLQEFE